MDKVILIVFLLFGVSLCFSMVREDKPDYLMLFFVHQDYPESTDSYLSKIRECFALGTIYISGNEKLISQMTLESNTHWLKSVDDLSSIEYN